MTVATDQALEEFVVETSAADGTVTFTFSAPEGGQVWDGSVYISTASQPYQPPPAGASGSVTVGTTFWGVTDGGSAVTAVAYGGRQCVVKAQGLDGNTGYICWWTGVKKDAKEAEFGRPFPAPPASSTNLVPQGIAPNFEGLTAVTAGTPAFTYGTAAELLTIGSSGNQTAAIVGLNVLDASAKGGIRNFLFLAGPVAGGPGSAAQIGGWQVYLGANGWDNVAVDPVIEFSIPAGETIGLWVQAAADSAGLITDLAPVFLLVDL